MRRPIACMLSAVLLAGCATAPAPAKQEATASNEPKFRTPADIINSRGFWGDTPPTKPKQATPAQVAAISARQALSDAVDPQPTASIDHAFHALAFAPVPSPIDGSAGAVSA